MIILVTQLLRLFFSLGGVIQLIYWSVTVVLSFSVNSLDFISIFDLLIASHFDHVFRFT